MNVLRPGEIPIVNRSGETAPAGSLARIVGRDATDAAFWEIGKPNAADLRNICMIPEELPDDRKGVGLLPTHPRMVQHSLGSPPTPGVTLLGTANGSWEAAAGNTLLVWDGDSDEAEVQASPPDGVTALFANGGTKRRGDVELVDSDDVEWQNPVSGNPQRFKAKLAARYVFPVTLSQVGGGPGDESYPASWTYDVLDAITEELLASNIDPTVAPHAWRRPSVGYVIPATFGYAHRDAAGVVVLGWINEVPDQEACSST